MQRKTQGKIYRSGLTLVELIVGVALMAMVATSLSVMSQHVIQVSENIHRLNDSTQVSLAIQRHFDRLCSAAIESDEFKGIQLVSTNSGHQGLAIRDTAGADLPTKNEIVFLTCLPDEPNCWCIVRATSSDDVPISTDETAWQSFFADTISDANSEVNRITDRIAVDLADGVLKPNVFWNADAKPSALQLSEYQGSLISWEDLEWPQGKSTAEYGLQRRSYSVLIFLLDESGYVVPVHLNHSRSFAIKS